MRKRISIFVISSLVLVLLSMVMLGITYGWFNFTINYDNNIISVGELRYTQSGSFISDNTVIFPDYELVDTTLSVSDSSPIDSQLRIKLEYTKCTAVGVCQNVVYTNHISVTINPSFTYDSNYWYYNGTTGVVTAGSGQIDLISSLYYDGLIGGNDYAGETISITLTVEVKQNDNVTWSELTSYDFSTGYPA
jgi:hypothetical protein